MRRRRKQRSKLTLPILFLAGMVAAIWWFWPDKSTELPMLTTPTDGVSENGQNQDTEKSAETSVPEAVIVDAEESPADEILSPVGAGNAPTSDPQPSEPAMADAAASDDSQPDPKTQQPREDKPGASEQLSTNPRINASLHRYQSGQVVAARQELNRMLSISRDATEQAELRRHLKKIADATVFSRTRIDNDPLTTTHTIGSGEYLINIGKQYNVPYEAIMLINGIEDPTKIRAGQKLKVPNGPFHVKIKTSKFRLDVYLGDYYIRSFPVALGADQGTPLGKWIVKDRLPNPTYYPPASAVKKEIIPPNDPTNPLGEHWISLEGTEGDAVGRNGYGIHGTIEPESIGKAASMGCVRMHNQDVAFLYKLMMPGHSTVMTEP